MFVIKLQTCSMLMFIQRDVTTVTVSIKWVHINCCALLVGKYNYNRGFFKWEISTQRLSQMNHWAQAESQYFSQQSFICPSKADDRSVRYEFLSIHIITAARGKRGKCFWKLQCSLMLMTWCQDIFTTVIILINWTHNYMFFFFSCLLICLHKRCSKSTLI